MIIITIVMIINIINIISDMFRASLSGTRMLTSLGNGNINIVKNILKSFISLC